MARRPRRMREDDPQEQDGPVPPLGPPAAMVTELLELRRRVELLRGAITIAGKIVARFASLEEHRAYEEACYVLGVVDTVSPASEADREAHRRLRASSRDTMTTTQAAEVLKVRPEIACSILVRLANSGLVQMDPESARAWQVLPVRGACEAVAS